jgi:hypothetical protein
VYPDAHLVRLPIRTGLVLAVAAFVVALPTAAGALPTTAASPAVATANTQTYQDSTGEDPAAPDITTIVVSNDDAGIINFRVNVPNRPTLGQDMYMLLFVDSDGNPATGAADFGGVDYVMELVRGEIALFRWDGTDFSRRFGDPSAVTLSFSYQAGVTIRISAAELGNTRNLRFFTIVESGIVVDPMTGDLDFTNAVGDAAPGGGVGLYAYRVVIARPTLVIRSVRATPAVPRAGQTFTLRMVVARSDTNAVLQNGRVTCVGRVAGRRLTAQLARVQGGAVTCTWQLPASAKGKTFRGAVTVVFEGLRASRSFSARVR